MKSFLLPALMFCFVVSSVSVSAGEPKSALMESSEIRIEKPYDYVYLAIFDTVNSMQKWVPELTEQANGLIQIRNTDFHKIDDSDRRIIRIRLARDGNITRVFLDPESRGVIGVSEVMNAIREKLGVQA